MNRRFVGMLITLVVFVGALITFKNSPALSGWLWALSREGTWLLPLVTLAALTDSINPCAFSVLLLTIAFFFSLGRTRKSILTIGAFYIAGIFVVYLLIGLGILQALHIFNVPHFMAKAAATLMMVLGAVNLLEVVWPGSPIKLRIPTISHKWMGGLIEQGTLPAVFALGVLVGLCEFPCTGGPYLLVLGLLHDQATRLRGLGYLVYYNVLFILPLVVMLALVSQKTLLEKVQQWQREQRVEMRLGTGIVMILLGLLVFAF